MSINVSHWDELGAFTPETLGLVDNDVAPEFEALTRLAMRMLRVPVALISIVQEDLDRQYFLSHQGLCQPWADRKETPLSHSFCQHVKQSNQPMAVRDAARDARVSDNKAVSDIGVTAYLGVPVRMPDGTPVGALCVIDGQPREWTDGDLVALEDLASCVSDEIKLRATVHIIDRERRRTQRYSAMRDSVATTFMAPDLTVEARLEGLLKAGCKAFGVRAARIARIDGGQIQMLFEQKIPTRNCNGTAFEWSAPLTRVLTSECRIVHFDDLPQNFRTVGAKGITVYAGVPLVLNGVLYGVMEFAGSAPRSEMWNNDDLSVLSIMAMLATTQLGMLDQITTLRKTESALVRELSVLKRATV